MNWDDLTADELDEVADTFYGLANDISRRNRHLKKAEWPEEVTTSWDRMDMLGDRFSKAADEKRAEPK
jgi:hypothetical protein